MNLLRFSDLSTGDRFDWLPSHARVSLSSQCVKVGQRSYRDCHGTRRRIVALDNPVYDVIPVPP